MKLNKNVHAPQKKKEMKLNKNLHAPQKKTEMKLNKNVHTPQKTQKGNWIKMCTLHRKHRKETK